MNMRNFTHVLMVVAVSAMVSWGFEGKQGDFWTGGDFRR